MFFRASTSAFALALSLAAGPADGCQLHPVSADVECRLTAPRVVNDLEPFDVTVTYTNLGHPARNGVDFLDDHPVWVQPPQLSMGLGYTTENACNVLPDSGVLPTIEPSEPSTVFLDDPTSPSADGPTRHSVVYTITPQEPMNGRTLRITSCQSACITFLDGEAPPHPIADFEPPLLEIPAGGEAPLTLSVRRNGYPLDRPLRVVVRSENSLDPADLFPLDPPEAGGSGLLLEAGEDEQSFLLGCRAHFPCYAGMANDLHVEIHDEDVLLWSSLIDRQEAPGRIEISETPLGRYELVELLERSGDGSLQGCEDASLHLRLEARNPFTSPLENVTLTALLPPELELVSADAHHHDNPLDDVTPSAAELAAPASVRLADRELVVELERLAYRFETPGPATVFRDLLVVDLVLRPVLGGIQRTPELVFADLTVTGTSAGQVIEESFAGFSVPVTPGPAPGELSGTDDAPLLVEAGDVLTWADGTRSGATSARLYRGDLGALDGLLGSCLATDLLDARHVDPALPPPRRGWFYLVAGHSCLSEGPLGRNSLDAVRAPAESCP